MTTDHINVLEGQLRECYGRVVYSHKTHEKCADILLERQACIKLAQIIISAIVTGGIVSTFFGTKEIDSGGVHLTVPLKRSSTRDKKEFRDFLDSVEDFYASELGVWLGQDDG